MAKRKIDTRNYSKKTQRYYAGGGVQIIPEEDEAAADDIMLDRRSGERELEQNRSVVQEPEERREVGPGIIEMLPGDKTTNEEQET